MKGKKTGGRDFPKGISPNPSGRPPLPAEAKAFRRLTQAEVIDLISKLKDATTADIDALIAAPETPAMTKWVCQVFKQGISGGDVVRLNAIWDRVLGRPMQALEHTGRDGGPLETRDLSALSDEEINAKIQAHLEKRKS